MSEPIKKRAPDLLLGGAVGAVAVLIAGFWFGPLTTNGALASAVDAGVVAQQAAFCAERGRADPDYVDGATFKALAFAEKRDFTGRFSTFDGQSSGNGRAVANACRSMLEAT